MTEPTQIVQEFIKREIHLTPNALEKLGKLPDSKVDKLLKDFYDRKDKPTIITKEIIDQFQESKDTIPSEPTQATDEKEMGEETEEEPELEKNKDSEQEADLIQDLERIDKKYERPRKGLEIMEQITGKSTSEGEIEDFVKLFNDRYERLSSKIKSREIIQNYTDIENIHRHEGDTISIVGLVRNKRQTRKNDAWLIEIEEPTGKAVVYVKDSERNKEVIGKVEKVVTDEVIGVRAKVPDDLKSGNRDPLIWGNEILWPEVPVSSNSNNNSQSKKEDEEKPSGFAVLVSDLHVGSRMFLPKKFKKFLKWLNGEAGNKKQMKMAERVKYLIIAGDLVDGIGVYPGQKDELVIESIFEQYKRVAELLAQVPEDITIIIAPGNHDAVRLAEPQPAMSSKVTDPLREIDAEMVGNPSFINLEGVKFVIYHGMGLDDMIGAQKSLDRENTVTPMRELLKRRHLAPIYGEPMGGKAPIAPEEKDYMVIDDTPDVLHCGHLHRYGCGKYRGILMINSATFQEQTVFMKRQGIKPTPGRVPLVNLETKEARAINFA